MSADNFLAVLETKKGTFVAEEMSCNGDKIADIGTFSDLRAAMIACEKYQDEIYVEYGVKFYPFPRKGD